MIFNLTFDVQGKICSCEEMSTEVFQPVCERQVPEQTTDTEGGSRDGIQHPPSSAARESRAVV